jgi:hypothetical protein
VGKGINGFPFIAYTIHREGGLCEKGKTETSEEDGQADLSHLHVV